MESLLDVQGVKVVYRRGVTRKAQVAVNGVSLTIAEGETLGLVGESGSGKTSLGRAIVGLIPIAAGEICFDGTAVGHLKPRMKRQLLKNVQMVFQDPFSSLNPALTIGQIVGEPLTARHAVERRSERHRLVSEMLTRVGLSPDVANMYPTQFSGGQRQRIAIARALIAKPRLVVCDEPTSSLDLSVQAQVLALLKELQLSMGLSYLFISHDLPVVGYVAHRVAVMHRGEVVETGLTETVLRDPASEYTAALLAAVPGLDPAARNVNRIPSTDDSGLRSAASTGDSGD